MVPSWTETLLTCGVDVIGRTRFCIHPKETIKNIPVVGGTKDIHWNKVNSLKADILLLDKEENPLWMAEQAPLPYLASHVQGLSDLPRECKALGEHLGSEKLLQLGKRFEKLSGHQLTFQGFEKLPGLIKWVNPPQDSIKNLIYVIWKDPWMAVSKNTFIGSVLKFSGLGDMQVDFEKPYPEFKLEDFDPATTLLLCSSEPYPFGKKIDFLKTLPYSIALVDGESFSWFGARSLKFLENLEAPL